jgi:hypothetical protein
MLEDNAVPERVEVDNVAAPKRRSDTQCLFNSSKHWNPQSMTMLQKHCR